VHGRTVEFGTKIDINIAAIPRGVEFKGRVPGGDGLKYTANTRPSARSRSRTWRWRMG